jgi:predicted RNA binding protein with dsRBD fold (UPF0201 family)
MGDEAITECTRMSELFRVNTEAEVEKELTRTLQRHLRSLEAARRAFTEMNDTATSTMYSDVFAAVICPYFDEEEPKGPIRVTFETVETSLDRLFARDDPRSETSRW